MLKPITLIALGIATHASAAIVANDDFNGYTAGAIAGQGLGTGFSGTWAGTGTANGTTVSTSGNLIYRNFTSALSTANQVWFSVDMNPASGADGQYFGLAFFDAANAGGNQLAFLGKGSVGTVWGEYVSGQVNGSTPVLASTATTLVGVMDYTNDKLVMWLNPTGTATYNLLTGVAQGAEVSTAFTTTGAALSLRLSSNTATTFDNLKVATLASDVGITAIPEPATYGLLGAGALAGITLVRRRRRA